MTGPQATRSQAKWALTGIGFAGCLILGVFTLILHSSVAKHRDAERRFRPVQAAILSSRVLSEERIGDRDDPRKFYHRPAVAFRYEVDGRSYTSERYAFDETSSTDPRYAETVAQRYPPGRSVTAWFDPDRPEVAILESAPPGTLTFGLLFLRPFWALGLFILFHAAWTWLLDFHTRRYLEQPPRIPCRIPGWGRLRAVGSGFVLTRRPQLVPWAFGPYFASTLLSLFALTVLDREDDPRSQEAAFAVSTVLTGCGVGLGLLQGRRVRFEHDRVVLDRPFGSEAMAATELASVKLGDARAKGPHPRPQALYLKARDGRTLRLNVFSLPWDNAAVAGRARQQVAELLGLAPSGNSASSS
jgi:hypothetical protein